MAHLLDIDWSSHELKHYSYNFLLILCLLISPIVFLAIAQLLITSIYIAVRFIRIKFGKKTKPDGCKAILITGATSGIGLLISKHFYKLGFSVFACYYNDQEPGYKELHELGLQPYENVAKNRSSSAQRPGLFLVHMDVRSQESIAKSAKEVDVLLKKHKMGLYYLINNAGLSTDSPFEWLGTKWMKDIIETNYTGTVLVTRQFLFHIIMNKGRVINVGSGAWALPTSGISLYCSSKTAMLYMSICLNEDLKRYGASCVCMIPGNFITSSNLIYPRYRCMQDSLSSLSEAELAVYKPSIEDYSRFMERCVKIKVKSSKDDPSQVSELFKIQLPDLEKRPTVKPGFFTRILIYIISKVDGGGEGKPLEGSGLKENYELAVRLVNPPINIYAGNNLWVYVNGPTLDCMPPFLHNWMGNTVALSLKRG